MKSLPMDFAPLDEANWIPKPEEEEEQEEEPEEAKTYTVTGTGDWELDGEWSEAEPRETYNEYPVFTSADHYSLKAWWQPTSGDPSTGQWIINCRPGSIWEYEGADVIMKSLPMTLPNKDFAPLDQAIWIAK